MPIWRHVWDFRRQLCHSGHYDGEQVNKNNSTRQTHLTKLNDNLKECLLHMLNADTQCQKRERDRRKENQPRTNQITISYKVSYIYSKALENGRGKRATETTAVATNISKLWLFFLCTFKIRINLSAICLSIAFVQWGHMEGELDSYVQLGGGWDSTVLLESRQ